MALNEYVRPEPTPYARTTERNGTRPGDALNQQATWAEILEPHGWEAVATQGKKTFWRRPSKTDPGWSATTGHGEGDYLYVFSTNAAPFAPQRAYDKFGAYAWLHHGGDYQAAAKALAPEGDGMDLLCAGADDEGNAQAVNARHGDRFLYCGALGWMAYTGTHWARHDAETQLERAITDRWRFYEA